MENVDLSNENELEGPKKLLGINTEILIYDGTIKLVQNIVKGDILMGNDSTPRNVLNIFFWTK